MWSSDNRPGPNMTINPSSINQYRWSTWCWYVKSILQFDQPRNPEDLGKPEPDEEVERRSGDPLRETQEVAGALDHVEQFVSHVPAP
jgi:hypothetical protein